MRKPFVFLTVCIMVVIFIFSSHKSETTYSLSGKTVEVTKTVGDYISDKYYEKNPQSTPTPKLSERIVKTIKEKLSSEYFIRKTAHFCLYFTLGACVLLSFKNYGFLKALLSVIICFIYASSDEIHQIFVDGRGSTFKDVILDTSAGFTAILIISLIILLKRKNRHF